MKAIVLFTTFFFLNLFPMKKEESKTITLTVGFEVTKYNKGSILFALYDSETNYMKSAMHNVKVKVENNKAIIKIENLSKGSYGFSFFHDVNNDGKLNKNFLGIPKEPYGFSNGEKGSFGPPDFEDIKFELKQDTTLNVRIK